MSKQNQLLDKALWVLSAIRHFEMKKRDLVQLSKSPLNVNTYYEEKLMDKADTCQRAINRLQNYYNNVAIEIAMYQLKIQDGEFIKTQF